MNIFLRNRLKLIFVESILEKEIPVEDISWSNKIIKQDEKLSSEIYVEAETEVMRMRQRK